MKFKNHKLLKRYKSRVSASRLSLQKPNPNSLLLALKLIKTRVYKKNYKNVIKIKDITVRLKRAFQILIKLFIEGHRMIFIGTSLNVMSTLNRQFKKTIHETILKPTWAAGMLTRRGILIKNKKKNLKFFNKQDPKFLNCKLDYSDDFIINLDLFSNKKIFKEAHKAKLFTMEISSELKISNNSAVYKIPGNFELKNNLKKNIFFELLHAMFKKAKEQLRYLFEFLLLIIKFNESIRRNIIANKKKIFDKIQEKSLKKKFKKIQNKNPRKTKEQTSIKLLNNRLEKVSNTTSLAGTKNQTFIKSTNTVNTEEWLKKILEDFDKDEIIEIKKKLQTANHLLENRIKKRQYVTLINAGEKRLAEHKNRILDKKIIKKFKKVKVSKIFKKIKKEYHKVVLQRLDVRKAQKKANSIFNFISKLVNGDTLTSSRVARITKKNKTLYDKKVYNLFFAEAIRKAMEENLKKNSDNKFRQPRKKKNFAQNFKKSQKQNVNKTSKQIFKRNPKNK